MNDVKDLIFELTNITDQIKILNERKKEIEGAILIQGGEDIKDTKLKSIEYADAHGNKVTYTEAQSLSIECPEYLKQIFGSAYKDIVEETFKTDYKVSSKRFERMLTALYLNDYSRITLEEFWQQLPCNECIKKALRRKLKGTDFNKDKGYLMSVAGFDERDSSDYAYLFADAVVWTTFISVCEMARIATDEKNIDYIIRSLNASVAVSETSKLKLERNTDGES